MRSSFISAAAALFVATAAPAIAAPTRDTPQPTAEVSDAPAPKAAKRYCVTDTALGSLVRQKVCKTRAQWIADDNFDPLAPQR